MFVGLLFMTIVMLGVFPYLLTLPNMKDESKRSVVTACCIFGVIFALMLVIGK